ncbi:MAG: UDP-N-acetylmuramate--L-alanine ligase [Christensenellaceae bacterium]|jgi:UDP-N-acetylmuramate--alanine ligase|nr:UDP-N-acetylmuramate--L-alanine ligase [Christensenellaceae bacterium]
MTQTIPHIKDHTLIHLIGIGGCSMNGLAQILAARGFAVRGSDSASSPFTQRLNELHIPVTIGQAAENVEGADLVIYSAAIKPTNPERVRAKELGIPELERSVALGQLSEGYEQVVGIAGCHGKTTITSMLALICERGALDASVHIGGYTDFLQGGTRVGSRSLFITEACEYVESFLTLRPTLALINNIDNDHLDYYKTIDNIVAAFRKFVGLLPEGGLFIACTDDPRVQKLYEDFPGNKLSYGMTHADFVPGDIAYDALGCPSYDLLQNGKKLGRIALQVQGTHQIIDSMAAAAVALQLGAAFADIAAALALFQNTRRRFEFYGERAGIRVFHDYAHHPAEIAATLEAAARVPHGKLWCVFQCNSFTRAKTLFTQEVDCFNQADEVLVPNIYPGREQDDGSVHARDMVAGICAAGGRALYIPTFEAIRAHLDAQGRPGDVVVTLGSGDVYKQTHTLL